MIPNTHRTRRRIRCWRACLAMLLLAVASLGWAADPGLEQRLEARLQRQPLAQAYAWLAEQPLPQAQQAEVLRWLGQMAMQLGDHAAAVEHFERLVLLEPLDLGSRLELTLAYAELGNLPAARASLDALHYHAERHLGDSPPPPAVARALAELESRLASGRMEGLNRLAGQLRGSLALAQGYDSNANLGARSSTISLNLWGEIPLQAELADESLAQPSHYTELASRISVPLYALLPETVSDDWQLVAGGTFRRYHELDSLHRRDFYLGAQWQPGERRQQLSLVALHQGVEGLPGQWSLNADYRRLVNTHWLASVGVQWQDEPYRSASRTLWAGLWREWQRALLHGRASWQLRPDRAAGDTWRVTLGADTPGWRWQRLTLNAYATLEHRQDTAPYSRQFFGDEPRRETTTTLGTRGRLPLSEALDLTLDASWEHTSASLALFENRRWQLEAGLAWRW